MTTSKKIKVEDDLNKKEDELKKIWKTTSSTIKKINLNWL